MDKNTASVLGDRLYNVSGTFLDLAEEIKVLKIQSNFCVALGKSVDFSVSFLIF